jgi:hypothetical protein
MMEGTKPLPVPGAPTSPVPQNRGRDSAHGNVTAREELRITDNRLRIMIGDHSDQNKEKSPSKGASTFVRLVYPTIENGFALIVNEVVKSEQQCLE